MFINIFNDSLFCFARRPQFHNNYDINRLLWFSKIDCCHLYSLIFFKIKFEVFIFDLKAISTVVSNETKIYGLLSPYNDQNCLNKTLVRIFPYVHKYIIEIFYIQIFTRSLFPLAAPEKIIIVLNCVCEFQRNRA